jgi:uncharacterized protein
VGESYSQTYPGAMYVPFIERVIEFAQASINAKDQKHPESLRSQVMASLAESTEELEALLRKALNKGSEVNSKSHRGATALMFAAANGDREAVKPLIDARADLNATEDTHGWTALIYAIWSRDHFIVKDMIEFYAEPDIKDKEGWTALDHAKATGDFEIMLLINARPRRGQHT